MGLKVTFEPRKGVFGVTQARIDGRQILSIRPYLPRKS